MRRQISTNEQAIRRISEQLARMQVRRAFLVAAYPGSPASVQGAPKVVTISFSDPLQGTRGIVIRARIKPGLSIAAADVGSPVSVRVLHGQVEVVSFG